MSQNYETCYSTLSNMKAYRQQCYNFLDYFIHFSFFSACNTAFSLSSLVSIFPLLPISFSLSFFFISPSLHLCFSFSLSFFSCHYLSLFLFLSRRRRFRFEAELANLKFCSPIWSSTRPGVVVDLCSSSSTALATDLAIDGWLSLVIDWSIGLGFCWRFWVFFFFFVEVFGFGICWRIRCCGCSLWRWL